MGSIFSCVFDEEGLDKHERERLALLQKGERFARKKIVAMGVTLGSDPVMVRLTEDQSVITWKSVEAPTFGTVKVTALQNVKPSGSTGLALLGKGNAKELELEAFNSAIRDTWVVALSEVVTRSKDDGKHGQAETEQRAREETESKAAYWASRRRELRDVEAAAAERKKKYADAGMHFTAQALAVQNGGASSTRAKS